MVWPGQSPDLNIMESVLDYTKRQSMSTEDLRDILQDIWNNIPAKFFEKLCAGVPSRTGVDLQAKGGHNKC